MTRRPAGATATLTAAAVIVAGWFGADLNPEDAAVLVAALTMLVSWRSPLPR